jgi:arginine-tRNA-protein transferase
MHRNDLFARLQFYATTPYPCPYLAERIARSQVEAGALETKSAAKLATATYSILVRHGFRRSGSFVYRHHCGTCTACVPVRVAVERFTPDRSQRRAQRRHAALSATLGAPEFSEEHFALYQRYQRRRHGDGGMDGDNREQYVRFLLESTVDTLLVDFREQGKLRMVSVIDRLDDGLSSVYTFFDPELPGASLGTYGVLWQIEVCRQLQLPYLYLGYWIAASRKMAYKTRFRPIEAYRDGQWTELDLDPSATARTPEAIAASQRERARM